MGINNDTAQPTQMNKTFWAKQRLTAEQETTIEGTTTTPATEAPSEVPQTPQADPDELKKIVAKERELAKVAKKEAAQLRDDLKAFQEKFANIDPSQYAALVAEREALATRQSEQERIQSELTTRFETEKIKLTETHTSKVKQLESQTQALQSQILALTRSQLLEKEFTAANGRSESSDGISYFQVLDQFVGNKFQLSEDQKKLIVIGDDGKPMMSVEDAKKEMTPKEYLNSLHRHEVLGSCFKLESVPSGSGQNLSARTTSATKPLSRVEIIAQSHRSGG